MTDWQPIETAPKDGTQFIGLHIDEHGDYLIANMKWEREDWYLCYATGYDNDGNECPPQYWIPRPVMPLALYVGCRVRKIDTEICGKLTEIDWRTDRLAVEWDDPSMEAEPMLWSRRVIEPLPDAPPA